MKVSGTIEQTEKKLKKVKAKLAALRKLREDSLEEWKKQEIELVDEQDNLENTNILQIVKLSNIDIAELVQRLTPAGEAQVFSELKASLADEPETAAEVTGSDSTDDNERIENDDEDE